MILVKFQFDENFYCFLLYKRIYYEKSGKTTIYFHGQNNISLLK